MCVGFQLTNRELYVAFARMILAFEISQGSQWDDRCLHPIKYNKYRTGLVAENRNFTVNLKARYGIMAFLESQSNE